MRPGFFLHFRPHKVPAEALRFTLTWGLGGAAVFLLLLQFISGILLNLVYTPTPIAAYEAVQHLQNEVFMGRLLRNIHHWGSNFLVAVALLHLFRVFFSRAFLPPRRAAWYSGLVLFILILKANFTGYLLPWDQLAYWAVTIATSFLSYIPLVGEWFIEVIRGGNEVSGATLAIFHAIHTTVLPFSLLICLFYHFWRIRRAGGVLINRQDRGESLPANPNLFVRELSAVAVIFAIILLFSMWNNAPLGGMANPQLTPENVKAPWYFIWLQELFLHLPPLLAVISLPLTLTVFLLSIPLISVRSTTTAAMRVKIERTIFAAFFTIIIILTITAIWFRGPAMAFITPW